MLQFDQEQGGAYQDGLYDPETSAARVDIATALTAASRTHYREHGWLSVEGLLQADELAAAKAAIDDLIADRVPGFSECPTKKDTRRSSGR